MTKAELMEQLKNVPEDKQILIANVAIEFNESMPTFDLLSVEEKNGYVIFEFEDTDFIDQDVNINGKTK
jgi:hypothetical protein